jgi:hypothetical protein
MMMINYNDDDADLILLLVVTLIKNSEASPELI